MNQLIEFAQHIPVCSPTPVVSIAPLTLTAPARSVDLELRVSAPVTGDALPVIVFSHGMGPSLHIPSLNGYAPLAQFWAAHGFVVIQPSHLNAPAYGMGNDHPEAPLFWRSRVQDMSMILDRLDEIEAMAPAIAGRLDRDRIAAAGHSMGGQTVGMLLGARLTDPKDSAATDVDMQDKRYKAGVLLGAPGNGGDSLSDFAAEHCSPLNPDFSSMTTPTLVVAGEDDASTFLTTRGPDWHVDPFRHGPGATDLLMLAGGKHGLGGIAGYDAKETDDENPDRLAATQRMTTAWLRTALYPEDPAWAQARDSFAKNASPLGRVESK